VLQARYTHGPGIDEPVSRTPMVPGLGSGQTAVLASTPDGLRGPVVDDGIKVNGQLSVGFVFVSGMPAPAIGQPIDSTGLEQPMAPIDVTAAAATGTLAVDLIDTGGIGGNAPLYLVTRDHATNQVLESRLLFPCPCDLCLDDAAGHAARRGLGDGAHDHAGGGRHAVLPPRWPRYR
jgi:hypothetical protein